MQRPQLFALVCITAVLPAMGTEMNVWSKALKSSYPDVRWQEHRPLKGDLTCQARKEVAILGTQGSRLMVAIFKAGASKKPIVLELDTALLATQVRMSIESQDFDMGTEAPGDVGTLPGFKRSKTCKGLKLDDERIDSVHIYWNREEGRFQTWQR